MDPTFDADTASASAFIDAIRQSANIALCDCVCTQHVCVCLVTETVERARIQPFLYEQGSAA